ncbi:shikimate dehydrogenase family protein [Teichococcus vastitatis]|uniref:Shikimate dehydrogenase n=1 Tax=Teichococcus vastitatis TaxID=2307076 RepID=A0ABS9W8F4_9PROT|nr:shikimate dehydrogenase [Pseudoroseomonas vastitatis]MCI0755571.1 shikimate dehydrogenase [Pseudoroseomonas vastitatis]
MTITGATRLFAILGDPVAPLRSPALFNAAFQRLARDAVFLPIQVPSGSLPSVWPGLAQIGNLDGVVITMPHKEAIIPLLQSLGSTARLTGTVNTVRRLPSGGWEGEMFDGEGFRDGLERAGHAMRGASILQVGCGAAGRAIAFALAKAGTSRLALQDAQPGRAAALAALLADAFPAVSVSTTASGPRGHDIVVNATPMGLREGDPLPLEPGELSASQVVADVIPNPEVTPLIAAARRIGCRTVTGRAMHEGQARLAAAYLGIEGWEA